MFKYKEGVEYEKQGEVTRISLEDSFEVVKS
jgi:hypothetical protein